MRLLKTALLGLAAVQVASAACNWGATCGNECFNPSHSRCCNDTFSFPHFQLDLARGAAFPLKCCVDPTGAIPAYADFHCEAIESPAVKRISPLVSADTNCGIFRDSCGTECFLPEFEFCCGDQIYPQTKEDPSSGGMPKPLYCCTDSNGKEYPSFSCDSTPSVEPAPEVRLDADCGIFRDSCGSDCFLPEFEFCCGDLVYPQTKEDPASGGMPKPLYCCTDANGKEYTSFSCDSTPTAAVLPAPEIRFDDEQCDSFRQPCGDDCFLPEFEFCCGTNVFPLTKEDPASGGQPKPYFCCTDSTGNKYGSFSCPQEIAPVVVLPAPVINLDDNSTVTCGMFEYPCGNDCYMPQIEFCCADTVYTQDQADPARGGAEYPMYCCTDANGNEYAAWSCN